MHKLLHRDKEISIRKKFEDAKDDPKRQWKTMKDEAGWNKNLSLDMINKNGITVCDPKGI